MLIMSFFDFFINKYDTLWDLKLVRKFDMITNAEVNQEDPEKHWTIKIVIEKLCQLVESFIALRY